MQPQYQGGGSPDYWKSQGADKKLIAGICGILLGGLGVHKFVLGYKNEGIILLAIWLGSFILSFFTCGLTIPITFLVSVFGLIEGVIYLLKSDEEFVRTYIYNKKPWL
ncbi:MAG: TM2 domain-containing protein [Pyrinomonadaceae bacterium]|nr:TM2 domain-containing protein [Pyrinomonadaceae bacterium]MCX7639033.1 TM2 domain-containing protein [Pyrinomonadaceae bacterium]MDW8303746.1 TM2 domain-containing protein [Acidobacteriota bacterium]